MLSVGQALWACRHTTWAQICQVHLVNRGLSEPVSSAGKWENLIQAGGNADENRHERPPRTRQNGHHQDIIEQGLARKGNPWALSVGL